ncbi:hypothetical protein BDP27DRAFT_1451644 [Rhodocollybia butyracea]|uniref:Uncharacterized protein n=1 Tax=Rhodocollybia butyracea TaxID=206335 RepID=A0A9P5PIH1_9AGAR|nr:hypothetical protein BDP27DRAFT_1451644 [Rhodocollybia butyracea]
MPPIQILLTLLWVSAGLLTTIASPLMIPSNVGNNNPTGILENRQALGRRAKQRTPSPKGAKSGSTKESRQIVLWIGNEGKADEHWSLVILPDDVLDAVIDPDFYSADKPLRGEWSLTAPGGNTIDLCEAKMSEDERVEFINEMEEFYMPVSPKKKGGSCMDYVRIALERLKQKGYITEMPPKFEQKWTQSYSKVRQKTLPIYDKLAAQQKLEAQGQGLDHTGKNK